MIPVGPYYSKQSHQTGYNDYQVVIKTSPSKSTGGRHPSSSSTTHTHTETITTSEVNGKRTVVKQTKKTHHTKGSKDAAVKITKQTTVQHSGQPTDSLNTRIQSTTQIALGTADDKTGTSQTESVIESAKNVEIDIPSLDKDTCVKHDDMVDFANARLQQTVTQQISVATGSQEITTSAKDTQKLNEQHHSKKKTKRSKASKKSASENLGQAVEDCTIKSNTTQEITAADKDTRTERDLSAKSVQQTVTQHINVTHGKQEFSTRSSQQTVVQRHSRQTVRSEGSNLNTSGCLEQTLVENILEPVVKEEIVSTDKEICCKQDDVNNNMAATGVQQSVTQQISISSGKQETSADAECIEGAVVKQHSKIISRSTGSRRSAAEVSEKSVVKRVHQSDAKQETMTTRAKGAQGMVVETEKTDQKHGTQSSSSSEKTVVQRVNKGNRKQEITITTSATSSEQHFVQVSTVKTVKKSKVTKKR